MTPKEKAEELVEKYNHYHEIKINKNYGKEKALSVVCKEIEYWQEVKQEINKL